MRVAAVQYPMRGLGQWSEFERQMAFYAEVAADYECQFLLYPELVTMQLLSMEPRQEGEKLSWEAALERLSAWTVPYKDLLCKLATRFSMNIIGGSHVTRVPAESATYNECYIVSRTGELQVQRKIHATPSENQVWKVSGGDTLPVFHLDGVSFGVLVCYDVEFPELARHLVAQGAEFIFVPYCTDERRGYLRVRYCAQARCVENQCYIAMAGTVGCLPEVYNMDIQYAQNLLLTPCDFPFAREGILAEGTPNVEEVVIGDFDLEALRRARRLGTVQNLKDRRHDLYESRWLHKPATTP